MSDGLTVPFALAVGLSLLGTSRLIVLGDVAELILCVHLLSVFCISLHRPRLAPSQWVSAAFLHHRQSRTTTTFLNVLHLCVCSGPVMVNLNVRCMPFLVWLV